MIKKDSGKTVNHIIKIMITKYNILIYKLVFCENHKANEKPELEMMFLLHDIHLYLGFNFHVCHYFINQHKQISTPVKYKTMLALN